MPPRRAINQPGRQEGGGLAAGEEWQCHGGRLSAGTSSTRHRAAAAAAGGGGHRPLRPSPRALGGGAGLCRRGFRPCRAPTSFPPSGGPQPCSAPGSPPLRARGRNPPPSTGGTERIAKISSPNSTAPGRLHSRRNPGYEMEIRGDTNHPESPVSPAWARGGCCPCCQAVAPCTPPGPRPRARLCPTAGGTAVPRGQGVKGLGPARFVHPVPILLRVPRLGQPQGFPPGKDPAPGCCVPTAASSSSPSPIHGPSAVPRAANPTPSYQKARG